MPEGEAAIPSSTETIHVDDPVVACDGGGGALGHPRVFLRIEARSVLCPYCSRIYALKPGSGEDQAH